MPVSLQHRSTAPFDGEFTTRGLRHHRDSIEVQSVNTYTSNRVLRHLSVG